MLIQISVYINKEQWEKLDKEPNKSQVVRDALDRHYAPRSPRQEGKGKDAD